MRAALAILLAVSFGCAGRQSPKPTYTIAEARWVEREELPPDPATEELPEDLPGGEDDVAVYEPKKLEVNPSWAGLVISERRAARDALFRLRYPELRANYEADRKVWEVHREAYETRLQLAEERILELQPTWWDEKKGVVLGAGGFVFGVIVTLVVYGLVTRTD